MKDNSKTLLGSELFVRKKGVFRTSHHTQEPNRPDMDEVKIIINFFNYMKIKVNLPEIFRGFSKLEEMAKINVDN